jgi:hypothetical protein
MQILSQTDFSKLYFHHLNFKLPPFPNGLSLVAEIFGEKPFNLRLSVDNFETFMF